MTGNGGIESRANRFAISNAFRQSRVKLSVIVTRVGRAPFRNPGVFAWYGQLGEFLLITSSPSHIQFLPLHGGARGRSELEVALVPVDLEQEGCPPVHPATDLKGYDRTVPDSPIDDKLVGHSLGHQFAALLDTDTLAF